MKKTILAKGIACAALFAACSNIHAEGRSGVEAGLGYTYSDFDNSAINGGDGWIGQLGYRFNDAWSTELMRNDITYDGRQNLPDGDANNTMLNVLYHVNRSGIAQPYISAGLGQFDPDSSDKEDVLNAGAGVKIFLNDNIMLRPEFRFHDVRGDINEGFFDANLMLSVLFGGSSKSTPKPVKPADADNDGVIDSADRCPTTPAGVSVDVNGCPTDADNDGVADYLDQCADTTAGVKVDEKGCPIVLTESVSIELKVNFDSNSDVVKQAYYPEIRRVAEFLSQYEGTSVEVEGHTDTRGSAAYNKTLSQRRANAVAEVLVNQMNVDAGRVSAVGYGEERPIADDSTPAGLLANRRVVGTISTDIKVIEQK